jgi:hypothetical protein
MGRLVHDQNTYPFMYIPNTIKGWCELAFLNSPFSFNSLHKRTEERTEGRYPEGQLYPWG